MFSPQWISTLVATVALIVSLVSLVRTRRTHANQLKLQEEHLQLQRTTAELHAKQLQLLDSQDLRSRRGVLGVSLVRTHRGYEFLIENTGEIAVKNIRFELLECPDSPLVRGDYDRKLPVPLLHPRGSVSLLAALSSSTPLSYEARLTWVDPDDTEQTSVFYVSV